MEAENDQKIKDLLKQHGGLVGKRHNLEARLVAMGLILEGLGRALTDSRFEAEEIGHYFQDAGKQGVALESITSLLRDRIKLGQEIFECVSSLHAHGYTKIDYPSERDDA